MARIFISGSSDGLGLLAAKILHEQGHHLVLHARSEERARLTQSKLPGAEKVLIADLSSMAQTKELAAELNAMGRMDAVIHNAGVYQESNSKGTDDRLPLIFAVNSLAPYILTCLIQKPERLIYMSSGMHLSGDPGLKGLGSNTGENKLRVSYSDSKLHNLILAKAVARKWPGVYSNAVNPGWVPTKMGGPGAPDDLMQGAETQAWLAVSKDRDALVSGGYFFHKKQSHYLPEADDINVQDFFIRRCESISALSFPAP